MFILKLVIIFFIYIILAHLLRSSDIYEGISPDLSSHYQSPHSNIAHSEQATTAQQSGTITYLNNILTDLRNDADKMKTQLNNMTKELTSNTSKLSRPPKKKKKK